MSFDIYNFLKIDWKHHLQLLGRGGAEKIFSHTMSQLRNVRINDETVCRTAPATPGPGAINKSYGRYVVMFFLFFFSLHPLLSHYLY